MELKKNVVSAATHPDQNFTGAGEDQSKIALKQDIKLEELLISLLSQNERILDHLVDKKLTKNPVSSIKYISELINNIIRFSNKSLNFNASVLRELMDKECKKNPNIKLVHVNENGLSFDTIINLFNGWTSKSSERQPIFEEICNSTIDIIKSYFLLFESCFRSDLMKKQWSETSRIHLEELLAGMKQIKF